MEVRLGLCGQDCLKIYIRLEHYKSDSKAVSACSGSSLLYKHFQATYKSEIVVMNQQKFSTISYIPHCDSASKTSVCEQ